MSKKKEFFLILFVSVGTPLFVYINAYSYFKNKPNEISIQKDISNIIQEVIKPKKVEPISLLFVGDIMLDRTIRKDGELYGYSNLFACLKEEFSKHDAVIGNLEGSVTNFKSVSRDASFQSPESFRFTFDVEAVRALTDIGLSIVSIANNHIKDFGDAGIDQTIQNAQNTNLVIFGDPRKGSQRYTIQNIKGTRIAFIPYNQFFGTKEQTYEDLKNTQEYSDIQIIFAHWGDEYTPVREDIKRLAHTFVDQGADLIIGAHPHVIQEHERYKNIPIYYSLGNFIFDQYWEQSVREGFAVTIILENNTIISEKTALIESIRHKGTCFKKISP